MEMKKKIEISIYFWKRSYILYNVRLSPHTYQSVREFQSHQASCTRPSLVSVNKLTQILVCCSLSKADLTACSWVDCARRGQAAPTCTMYFTNFIHNGYTGHFCMTARVKAVQLYALHKKTFCHHIQYKWGWCWQKFFILG